MRYCCSFCGKSVSSELPDDSVIRGVIFCPECIQAKKVLFPEDADDVSATMAYRLAQKIVDDLMVNGAGEKADRLVLIDQTGRDLGGWGKVPLLHRIAAVLKPGVEEGREDA